MQATCKFVHVDHSPVQQHLVAKRNHMLVFHMRPPVQLWSIIPRPTDSSGENKHAEQDQGVQHLVKLADVCRLEGGDNGLKALPATCLSSLQ